MLIGLLTVLLAAAAAAAPYIGSGQARRPQRRNRSRSCSSHRICGNCSAPSDPGGSKKGRRRPLDSAQALKGCGSSLWVHPPRRAGTRSMTPSRRRHSRHRRRAAVAAIGTPPSESPAPTHTGRERRRRAAARARGHHPAGSVARWPSPRDGKQLLLSGDGTAGREHRSRGRVARQRRHSLADRGRSDAADLPCCQRTLPAIRAHRSGSMPGARPTPPWCTPPWWREPTRSQPSC